MSGPAKSTRELELAELAYAAGGVAPEDAGASGSERATFLRLVHANYRASEALSRMEPHRRLPLARALLARGKVAEAERALDELERLGDPSAEFFLERARLNAFAGRWEAVIADCGWTLAHAEVSMLSRSAAHQIRANAWVEIGEYARAAADLDDVDTYASLLPHGQVTFYGRAARVKVAARIEGIETARRNFERLLVDWKKAPVRANLNEFFTLVRVALDLSRLAGEPHANLALAAVNLAKSLGDETFVGLGYLDLWAAVPASERAKVAQALAPYLASQPRVRTSFEQVQDGSEGIYETSRRLGQSLETNAERAPGSASRHCRERIDQIFALRSSVVADLAKRTVRVISVQPRMRQILTHLSAEESKKQDLFRSVWGIPHYRSERHDALIRTAVKRVREQTGFEVRARDGLLSLSPALLVLDL